MSYGFGTSSSPPSTPERKSQTSKSFLFGTSNLSTTPAGPPPSSGGSFTPAGNPPSSYLASSIFGPPATGSGKPLSLTRQNHLETAIPGRSGLRNEVRSSPRASSGYGFGASDDEEESVDDEPDGFGGRDRDERHLEDNEAHGEDDTRVEFDIVDEASYEQDDYVDDHPSRQSSSHDNRSSGSDLIGMSLRNSEGPIVLQKSLGQSFPGRPKESTYGTIAKDIFTRLGFANIEEPDDLILATETIMEKLYVEDIGTFEDEEQLSHALASICDELLRIWTNYNIKTALPNADEYSTSIGPGPSASNFANANFLAQLVLKIHHSTSDGFRSGRPPGSQLPGVVLEWMDQFHDLFSSQLKHLESFRPSPCAHRLYWNTVLNALLRGRVKAVIVLLREAGWRHACRGPDDASSRSDDKGYSGDALANVEKVIEKAANTLAICPASRGDWNICSNDWALFRLQVSRSVDELKRFADGRHGQVNSKESSQFDDSSRRPDSYSMSARKAESRVPWHIYQNLLTLYSLVLGDVTAAVENAQDWCEATIGLFIWQDVGKDLHMLESSHPSSRRSLLSRSESKSHINKLRECFHAAISGSADLQVNTLEPVEVALASLFEGDYESLIGFLRAWSGPVSCAVAELGSHGRWLSQPEVQSLINMDSLDEDDLDLLGLDSSPTKVDSIKDQTLIAYAGVLSKHRPFNSSVGTGRQKFPKEGWELAIAILGRLDSAQRRDDMLEEFSRTFLIGTTSKVNKLWRLLNRLDLTRHAERIAESYADRLADETHRYGEALWYYSLAHKSQKVKDVLDLLISMSLIHSTAYPPEAEMDTHLKEIIEAPGISFTELSCLDYDAAELLHRTLSGYATLRRFYLMRDEEVLLPKGQNPQFGTIKRKVEAASALLAVIVSSDDNILGGLYDESRGAIVSIDFLLALLAEAMPFVNQPDFLFTSSQIEVLLKAIEDIQSVNSRIYTTCNEFLSTVIASAQGLKGSTPTDMLNQSMTNSGGSGSFSLLGSSMLASQLQRSIGNSGMLVKGNVRRGWDWRSGITAATRGEDILRILRLGLARDLAKAWIAEVDARV